MTTVTTPQPCARWTSDVGGKQDYDGRLLDISTRYWPAWKSSNGMPSARASILIRHGEPDEYGYGDYSTWREQEFEAPTEAEVKVLVEAWVAEQFADVLRLLGATLTGPE